MCIDFGPNPRYVDCFVSFGVVRMLLLFLVSVDLSMGDLIKLGRALVAMGTVRERPCDNTSCLSCLPREAVNIIIIIIVIFLIACHHWTGHYYWCFHRKKSNF